MQRLWLNIVWFHTLLTRPMLDAVKVHIFAILPIVCAVQKSGSIAKIIEVAAICTHDIPWLVVTPESQGMLWSPQGDLGTYSNVVSCVV